MDATLRNSFGTGGADGQTGAPGRTMNRLAKVFVLFVALIGLGVWSSEALAIAKFARVAGNWSAVGTWSSVSCAAAGATTVPSAADDVTICNGINVAVDGAGVAGSVTIAPGVTATALTLGAAGTLTVTNAGGLSGNVIINGSIANQTRSLAVGARTLTVTGNVTINGGATTGGANNISQLTVTTTPGTANIGGNLIINAGTVNTSVARATVSTGTINVTGDVTLTGGITSNTRDVLLSVTGASAVGAGVNIGGNLNINSTLATTSTVSITAAAPNVGRITVNGAVGVNNGDVVTIGNGVFTVSNAAATFTNSNTAIVATTTVSTGLLSIAGNLTNGSTGTNTGIDTITLSSTGTITVDGTLTNNTGTTNGTITTTTTGTINANGNFLNNGVFIHSAAGNLNLCGTTATMNGTFTRTTTTGTVTSNKLTAGAQTLSGTALGFSNFVMNSANGVTLGADATVNTLLTLTAGNITTTSAFTLISATTFCPASVSPVYPAFSPNSYVIGNLRLTFQAVVGLKTCIYHVGDNIGYAPIIVALTTAGATGGTLTGRADSGDHPDTIANISGIDQTKSANRYWTLTPGTLATYTSYAATLQFCAAVCTNAERDATATVGNFIVAKKNLGAWIRPTVGARTATTIQVTGITSAQGFGEFAVGEPLTGVYKGVNQLIDLRENY